MPQITLVPTGQRFQADPRETVLAAALRAGLNLPHSCRGGHCASCRARVIVGEVAYPGGVQPAGITTDEVVERYALLCQASAVTDLTVETREARPAPDVDVHNLPCRIDRMERLADDVMAVFLRLPAVEGLAFRSGQYIDFILSGARRRSFSIANAPTDGLLIEVHVRRASDHGFTGQLFDTMRAGTLLRIEGPLGQFWFRGDSKRPPLMIGGGTGYAPLRAMLRQLLSVGDRRPIRLYWGARTNADLYEDTFLRNVATVRRDFTYVPVLSHPGADDRWQGRTGLVHEAVIEDLGADLAQFDVYASGPPGMVEAIRREFPLRGLPREHLYFDSFDYAPDTLEALRQARLP
jgi:CDP-4-dehydro-6-deoxyglucose reductase